MYLYYYSQVTGDGTGSGADPISGEFLVFTSNVCYGCPKGKTSLIHLPFFEVFFVPCLYLIIKISQIY